MDRKVTRDGSPPLVPLERSYNCSVLTRSSTINAWQTQKAHAVTQQRNSEQFALLAQWTGLDGIATLGAFRSWHNTIGDATHLRGEVNQFTVWKVASRWEKIRTQTKQDSP